MNRQCARKGSAAQWSNLGEIWYLSALADWLKAHQRNRFLLTAPPRRLPGALLAEHSSVA
jgi:hypothetical protein